MTDNGAITLFQVIKTWYDSESTSKYGDDCRLLADNIIGAGFIAGNGKLYDIILDWFVAADRDISDDDELEVTLLQTKILDAGYHISTDTK